MGKNILSPALIAMMLRKSQRAREVASSPASPDVAESDFTPLEEILGSFDSARRTGDPVASGTQSTRQTYRSPSLEEILSDKPQEKARLVMLDKSQTAAPSTANMRSNLVQIAANSVTVPIPIYAVPPGYQPSGDGTNMYLRDRNGNHVKNPLLQKRIDDFRFNKCGIAAELGSIAGESAGGLGKVGAAIGGVVAGASNTIKGLCS